MTGAYPALEAAPVEDVRFEALELDYAVDLAEVLHANRTVHTFAESQPAERNSFELIMRSSHVADAVAIDTRDAAHAAAAKQKV
eukprot:CAMPEP_0185606738 /NCGR_PEP_ID=MMETSP0436-20130131/4989_1 /TAXON_ID=626734 ORGANISM="Favella taraikaensis, Strain Fe Narragansett Bay" /NCGR_SAMPLE_ID=MMETSP0436 /ASSEMBLY_ACC=CAM_ASM_000390 /LENGTH=83 /DNA_ID=CAMNT_0028238397 /DNA_START=1 /DNA_END=252 /DNA_ORIENTATION=+